MLHPLSSIVDLRAILCEVAREAFPGLAGRPVFDGGRGVGTIYESPDAVYCFLEELAAPRLDASREAQTTRMFETIERVLAAEGMEFRHLVRTWFYFDRIFDWYDEFNRARTPFFESRGTFDGLVPASTGIGIANRLGAPMVAGALAIRPKAGSAVSVREVPSPLQCSAVAYQSAFSRAVEVKRDGRRELYISGTAGIEPGGRTACLGDPRAQMDLTMRVVAALLESRRMDWRHCTRAIAYVKRPEDAPLFAEWLARHALAHLPFTWMHGDICRDDLLFEIELDAVEQANRHAP